jgi:putative ABC transport system substrate-binding protein
LRRREVLAGLASATAAWPLITYAQQARLPVIGFLNGASPEGYARNVAAFRDGLKESGYIEGQNVLIEYRWAEGRYDRLPALAGELVRFQVAVMAATSTPAALAAKAATTTIPIVFTTSSDPVQLNLVTRLSGQGGNITGATQLNTEVAPKRLALLHELMPTTTLMALLVNPTNPTVEIQTRELQAAAGHLGVQLHVLHASAEPDLPAVFASLAHLRVGGLVIGTADPFLTGRTKELAAMALHYRVPAIYQYPEFAAAGGLMSYGGSITDSYRLAGVYAGRILNGANPGDLPVQQTAKIELVINLKTAKALGLTFPLSMLGRADEVIE